MRRTPEPVFNVLQAFLRTVLFETRPTGKYSRGICTRCLRSQNRTSGSHSRTPGLQREEIHVLPFCIRRICHEARNARFEPSSAGRGFASVSDGMGARILASLLWPLLTRCLVPKVRGPLEEYDERVYARVLRDDEHQRSMESIALSPVSQRLIWIRHRGASAGPARHAS